MKGVALHINEQKRRMENVGKIGQWQETIADWKVCGVPYDRGGYVVYYDRGGYVVYPMTGVGMWGVGMSARHDRGGYVVYPMTGVWYCTVHYRSDWYYHGNCSPG